MPKGLKSVQVTRQARRAYSSRLFSGQEYPGLLRGFRLPGGEAGQFLITGFILPGHGGAQFSRDFGVSLLQLGIAVFTEQEVVQAAVGGLGIQREGILSFLGQGWD